MPACVHTSLIAFVPFPLTTKEIQKSTNLLYKGQNCTDQSNPDKVNKSQRGKTAFWLDCWDEKIVLIPDGVKSGGTEKLIYPGQRPAIIPLSHALLWLIPELDLTISALFIIY